MWFTELKADIDNFEMADTVWTIAEQQTRFGSLKRDGVNSAQHPFPPTGCGIKTRWDVNREHRNVANCGWLPFASESGTEGSIDQQVDSARCRRHYLVESRRQRFGTNRDHPTPSIGKEPTCVPAVRPVVSRSCDHNNCPTVGTTHQSNCCTRH